MSRISGGVVFVIVRGVGPFGNAKEPDMIAEFSSFSRRLSAFIRLFPPVLLEKYLSFSLS